MKPDRLSATAILTFQGCAARFKATYIDRGGEMSGTAASKGTVCHNVLERWVVNGLHYPRQKFAEMEALLSEEYEKIFGSDRSSYDDCLGMLRNWWDRSGDDYWDGRTVLSTEAKRTFDLKLRDGTVIPFTYIMDRMDDDGRGHIDIIDYKSVAAPVQPEEMKERIQPRAYALAAQIEYPDVEEIWMSFDLLRYDIVGSKFSKADNAKTYRYLQDIAQKIVDSDGTEETLNPECRWCVRKLECKTLLSHVNVGGILGFDLERLVDIRAQIDYQVGALRKAMEEIDDAIIEEFQNEDLIEYETAETKVDIKVSARREADSERVIKIVGPEIAARYGKLGVTDIDKILKDEDLTEEQQSQVRQLVRKKHGKAYIKTKPKHPFGEDD